MDGNWASPESVRARIRVAADFERELREAIAAVDSIAPKPVEVMGFRLVTSPSLPPDTFEVFDRNGSRWRFTW